MTKSKQSAPAETTDRDLFLLANEMLALNEAAERLRLIVEALCTDRGVPLPSGEVTLAA